MTEDALRAERRRQSKPNQWWTSAPAMSRWFAQLWLLAERYWHVKSSDRSYLLTLALQAPLIGFLLMLVYYGCDPYSGALMFCLAIAALWFGAFAAVREIVAENAVYERERLLGLRIDAYVLSKLPLLCIISCAQSGILLVMIYPVLAIDNSLGVIGNLSRAFDMLGVVSLTAAGGVSLGLMLSALSLAFGRHTASRSGLVSGEAAMSLVPLALLPQVILGGPFYIYDEALWVTKVLSRLTLSRWSLSALLSLEETGPRAFAKQLGMRGENTAVSCCMIALMSLCLTATAAGIMKYLDVSAKNRIPEQRTANGVRK
jgi:ABC transport system ATP-binding/permease protein